MVPSRPVYRWKKSGRNAFKITALIENSPFFLKYGWNTLGVPIVSVTTSLPRQDFSEEMGMISKLKIYLRFWKTRRTGRTVAAMFAAAMLGIIALPSETMPAGRVIKINLVQNLDFGGLGVGYTAGTAVVSASGIKSVSAGILDLGGVALPAVFDVTGERNQPFTITLPASATISPVAGISAQLSGFQSIPPLTGIFDSKGRATVTVGATINLTPGMAESTYAGPFDILVSY